MSLIERMVRKSITGQEAPRTSRLRMEAQRIALDVQTLDGQLERAEQRRVTAERERDSAIFELERLFHFVPAYLIFKDPKGVLIRVNETTAAGFSLKPADMIGKNQREFWPSEQCDRFEADDAAILESREGRYGYLEDVQWDGAVHVFRTWKAPMFNGHPDPIGVMLFAIDVTIVGDTSIEVTGDLKKFRHED